MEFIFEFLFELIVEGSLEASTDKKVPWPLRILAAVVLIGVYGGLIGFCFCSGIRERSWGLIVLGIMILIITVLGVRAVYKKRKYRQ